MLDALLLKCTSLAHFQQIIGVVDQVANLLKTGFNGPLEQEVIDIITTLLTQQSTTVANTSNTQSQVGK
jgi:hypothetical protein